MSNSAWTLTSEYKAQLFDVAFKYLSSIPDKDDFILKDIINLLLSAGKQEEALRVSEDLENKEDKFMQQTLCKIYYAKGNFEMALAYIEKAIAQEKPEETEYCAAFRHDKAKCLLALGSADATNTMKNTIQLQPNERVKREWELELEKWES